MIEKTTFGHIEGLLEAWLGRGADTQWQHKELEGWQRDRLIELFDSLSSGFVVRTMNHAAPSDKATMTFLSML